MNMIDITGFFLLLKPNLCAIDNKYLLTISQGKTMDFNGIIQNYIAWIFSGIGTETLIKIIRIKLSRLRPNSDPIITKNVKGLSATSKLICATFKRNDNPDEARFCPWVDHRKVEVDTNQGQFSIRKDKILQHLQKKDDPYKFCLIVRKDELQESLVNLLEADCIITGTGEPDKDASDMWRIWFLVDKEPIHPETIRPKYLNHLLY